WLADNLRTTRYQDGSPIRTAFIPEDDPDNLLSYGRLYDWHDVSDARNLCPVGWRVASDEDWKALERAIGAAEKEIDSMGWRGDDDIAITLKATQSDSLLTSFDQARINLAGF
ncbi:fibrobacter succinogenes major paralogous domain-containing protein, partial [Pseudoalteromonas sp. SIMBA_148]